MANPDDTTRCLMVLGMHRSGTSALTRLLNLHGAAIGGEVVPADEANIAGYWENRRFTQLNKDILKALGSTWHDVRPLPPRWQTADAVRKHQDQIEKEIEHKFNRLPLWVLKDPRTCRLMPLWLGVFEKFSIETNFLLIGRHPYEVAASIERRNGLPREKCLLLWLIHLLEAEAKTREKKRVLLTYDEMLDGWVAAVARIEDGLDFCFPKRPGEVEHEVDQFLSAGLRHHCVREVQAQTVLERWALEAYEAYGSARKNHGEALLKLDEIRDELTKAQSAFTSNMLGLDGNAAFVADSQMSETAQRFMLRCLSKPLRRPKISIVIPVFNQAEYTVRCLRSIRENSPKDDMLFEVVVVDNGSSDATPDALSSFSESLKVWRNEKNLGFARACNQGALLSDGDLIVFLNNDTEVHPGWLTPLIDELESNESSGVVGGRLLYPDNRIQHAGVAIGRDRIPYHIHRFLPKNHPLVLERTKYPIISAACAAVRRLDFVNIGLFDEEFMNGHEDIDLCLRYRQQGMDAVYRPDCVVTHHESVSEGRLLSRPRNLARTLLKWRYDLVQDDFKYKYPVLAQREASEPLGFAIKIGTPDRNINNWGDIYFAECLAKELSRAGHRCQVHYLNEWGGDDRDIDVVVHLKGLSEYHPKPYNINIMWMLNHPTFHTTEELSRYDAVLVASLSHARKLKTEVKTRVVPFLQATDPEHFHQYPIEQKMFDLLFVGNNTGTDRLSMRQVIADLLPTPHRLAVWGQGWKGKLPRGVLQGEFMPWEELPKAYNLARIVLNDHQAEMREHGFINNRTLDAVACGAVVVSDTVKGMEKVLPVYTYRDRYSLHQLVDKILKNPGQAKRRFGGLKKLVLREFTFEKRVQKLTGLVRRLREENAKRTERCRSKMFSFMTVEKPLVSVLVGTYNRKRFLPAAINSIQAQTYPAWELILVNDGGEPVDDIVRKANDQRIKLINLDRNLGKAAAINRGFAESSGAFVAYTDDDDIWYPDHLERLLVPLTNISNVKMAYSDCYEVWLKENSDRTFSEKERQLRYCRQVVFNDLMVQNFILGIVVAHRRDLFRQAGGMDERLKVLIDWDLWRRLAALAYPYHVSRITAERYFRESNDTSGFGHITNISKADPGLYSRNRLRIIFKKFPPEVEVRHLKRLFEIRNRSLLNLLTAKAERAEMDGNIEKARRAYRVAARLRPNDVEILRNAALFELFRGDPHAGVGMFERCLAVGRETNSFTPADILYATVLNLKTGEAAKARDLLDQIHVDENLPEMAGVIDYYRRKAVAA
jgi:GT2 family glycosyltransferase